MLNVSTVFLVTCSCVSCGHDSPVCTKYALRLRWIADEEDYFDKDDDDDSQRDTGAATAGPADAEALAAAAPQANGVLTAASPIHALPGLGALQEYGEDDDLDDDNDSATGMETFILLLFA